jgi:hypothetical protein
LTLLSALICLPFLLPKFGVLAPGRDAGPYSFSTLRLLLSPLILSMLSQAFVLFHVSLILNNFVEVGAESADLDGLGLIGFCWRSEFCPFCRRSALFLCFLALSQALRIGVMCRLRGWRHGLWRWRRHGLRWWS